MNIPAGTTTEWGSSNAKEEIFVGGEPQLFCDDFLVSYGSAQSRDYAAGVFFNVAPVSKDPVPVMLPDGDKPWETGISWVTVLHDQGMYRCWYNTGYHAPRQPEFPHRRAISETEDVWFVVGYAESDDGISWRKPALNLVELEGSKANNIVFLGDMERYAEGAVVFVDPTADPDERYKMVFRSRLGLKGAHSPDGLKWTYTPAAAFAVRGLDTQNSACYDPVLKRYVAYIRSNSLNYGGRDVGDHPVKPERRGRAIARMESLDFQKWSLPEIVIAPDIIDGLNMDMYTGPYSGYRDLHFQFLSAYYHWSGKLNLQVAVSRDNINWVRPTRETLVDNGGEGAYDEYRIYAGPGILPAGKDEIAVYTRTGQGPHPGTVDPHYEPGDWKSKDLPEGAMGRVVMRRDRIVGIEAGSETGIFATRNLIFDGKKLTLNAEPTGPDPEIRVQVVQGTRSETAVLPGFTFDDSVPLTTDELDGMVKWKEGSDMGAWSGKPVRLQFHMRNMRIYGFRFAD